MDLNHNLLSTMQFDLHEIAISPVDTAPLGPLTESTSNAFNAAKKFSSFQMLH
jgi:hypothetical protein